MAGDSRTGFFPSADNDRNNNNVRILSTSGPSVAPWWAKGNRFLYLHNDPEKFTKYIPGVSQSVQQNYIGRNARGERQLYYYDPPIRLGGANGSALLIKDGNDYKWNDAFQNYGQVTDGVDNLFGLLMVERSNILLNMVYETDLKKVAWMRQEKAGMIQKSMEASKPLVLLLSALVAA